jgi:FkbH-like protein
MLAGWRINWADKAANLEALADQMNLGLDAFVFLDDSAVECDRVRRALPEVDVLELGADPSRALDALAKYDGWSRLRITADDLRRTSRYQAEQERVKVRGSAESLGDFVASLELVAEMEVLGEDASDDVVGRVAQLTQRTNQFNATTRRYGPGEISAFIENPDALVLRLQVRDRFGDYGTVGVAILVHETDDVRLDTFLLSCRVLGRGIEDAFLDGIVSVGLDAWSDANAVRVEYRESPKNAIALRYLREVGLLPGPVQPDPVEGTYTVDRSWSPERQDVTLTVVQRSKRERASSTT